MPRANDEEREHEETALHEKEDVARTSRTCVGKIWSGIKSILRLLFWFISLVTYLNVLPYIWRLLCHLFGPRKLRKHSYAYNEFMVYSPTVSQWFGKLFRSEQSSRRRLIQWVHAQIPARKVVDFNRSWSNGVSLCALIEALVPDTCPRFDLLNPQSKVNNCRLGMKLVQRELGIVEPMAPEIMADPRRIQDKEMKKYLLTIQYAMQTPLEIPEVTVKIPDAGGQLKLEDKAECTASGSGLVLAVVGKRARFNINTQTYKSKHLFVEIIGPSGERLKKKLVDVLGGLRGKGPLKQSSKDDPLEGTDIVSFSYQFVKVGHYQVNYVPRLCGIYEIAITWGGEHINNSPYNIRATLAKGAEPPLPFTKTKTVSFQDEKESNSGIPETVPEDSTHPPTLAARGRRQSLVRQSHVTRRGDSSESSGSGTLSTFSSINSSIAASIDKESELQPPPPSSLPNQFSRQTTMSSTRGSLLTRSSSVMYGTVDGPPRVRTKRKVLRRIIKGAGGKEELIHYPQDKSRGKSTAKESTKLPSTERSSPQSTSPRTTPAIQPVIKTGGKEKVVGKYGDRMSKIILGRALYEVSKKLIMNNSKGNVVKENTNVESKADTIKSAMIKEAQDNGTKIIESKSETKVPKENTDIKSSTVKQSDSPGVALHKSESGNKPLAEVQQITQEFSPQISRDSDTSNSEREGPLGQEANEQSNGKHKGNKVPFTPLSIKPIAGPNTDIDVKLLETVDRNGPDGQEKVDEESVLHAKKKKETLEQKNKKFIEQNIVGESKENIAPNRINENVKPDVLTDKTSKLNEMITKSKTKETQQAQTLVDNKPVVLKVKRLPRNRPQSDKGTQCTAQGIKEETGWVSRRTIFQTKQKQNRDNDSALGESRGSSMAVSNTDSRDVDVANWKSVEKDSKALKALEDFIEARQEKQELFDSVPFRPRVPSDSVFVTRQRTRNFGRQATFDSGYSDENSHFVNSQRSSRDHSSWQSRSPSSSSVHSILNTPPPGLATKPKVPSIPTIEQSISFPTMEQSVSISEHGSKDMITPTLDVAYLTDSNPADVSSKTFPQDEGSLKVENAFLISSTNPTPGNSPLPTPSQLSTPAPSIKSTSPPICDKHDMSSRHDISSSMEKSSSPIAGMSARDIGEKLVSGDMSLDVLLQSLEHDPEYSTREFLRKFRPAASRENTSDSLQLIQDPSVDQWPSGLESVDGKVSPRPGSSKSSASVPLADKCRATGVGLYQGLVNTKNNFQVQTENAGDGSVGVTIRGPQPHTVVESNVVYTGDDLYEVMYEVNLPGFYVISVKWDDKHIPDSPFIVKVTF